MFIDGCHLGCMELSHSSSKVNEEYTPDLHGSKSQAQDPSCSSEFFGEVPLPRYAQ
jgi:hypothetical protein